MAKTQNGIRPYGNASTPQHQPPQKAKKTSGVPRVLIALGSIMLVMAVCIAGYGFIDDYLAGQRAQTVLARIREDVPASASTLPQPVATGPTEADGSAEPAVAELSPALADIPEENTPPALTEDAPPPEPQYDAIGILSIPKLALELPVLSECNDAMLKVSICRYEGEALGKPERLVVAGHNYKSHFGRLPVLAVGDEVFFSNTEGVIYNYIVTGITDISMYDQEALEQGEWDLTLFTCASDRSRRILIRCQEN